MALCEIRQRAADVVLADLTNQASPPSSHLVAASATTSTSTGPVNPVSYQHFSACSGPDARARSSLPGTSQDHHYVNPVAPSTGGPIRSGLRGQAAASPLTGGSGRLPLYTTFSLPRGVRGRPSLHQSPSSPAFALPLPMAPALALEADGLDNLAHDVSKTLNTGFTSDFCNQPSDRVLSPSQAEYHADPSSFHQGPFPSAGLSTSLVNYSGAFSQPNSPATARSLVPMSGMLFICIFSL
ncbi:unnamed protein product [Protopolystoma xenopodis]|uniref:Uncharacterized protein n=1 Tax=Protopolystoma xenopodis TaxID=117903 RepID=A0A448XP67_9PLAT|nr:unnamed protein product [Protopolystoma xenopodis]